MSQASEKGKGGYEGSGKVWIVVAGEVVAEAEEACLSGKTKSWQEESSSGRPGKGRKEVHGKWNGSRKKKSLYSPVRQVSYRGSVEGQWVEVGGGGGQCGGWGGAPRSAMFCLQHKVAVVKS